MLSPSGRTARPRWSAPPQGPRRPPAPATIIKHAGLPQPPPALVPAVGAWAGRGDRPGCQVLGPTAVLGPIAVVWGGRGTQPRPQCPRRFLSPNLKVQFFYSILIR